MKKALVMLLVLSVPVALAACSSGGSGEASSRGGGDVNGAMTTGDQAVASSGGGTGGEAALEGGASGKSKLDASVPEVGPRIIQTASLRMTVARGSFEDAVQQARSVAGSLGGFVVSSSERKDPGRKVTTGTLVLRVPQARYSEAMQRLGDVGRIVGRAESGEDVSAEFVDLSARRRNLEAVELQLLKLLDRADSVAGALAVQSRLDDVQLQLEQVRGQLRYLDNQTSFATITLALRERLPVGAPKDSNGGIVDAWADGAHAFARVTAGTFVVIATITPVLVLLLLAFLGWRLATRRSLVPRWGGWPRA
ncbi:MAG TPA: DUF4349 domain-containing protein [Gaiellaceae bacterium]|jgi:hypothetical protein